MQLQNKEMFFLLMNQKCFKSKIEVTNRARKHFFHEPGYYFFCLFEFFLKIKKQISFMTPIIKSFKPFFWKQSRNNKQSKKMFFLSWTKSMYICLQKQNWNDKVRKFLIARKLLDFGCSWQVWDFGNFLKISC